MPSGRIRSGDVYRKLENKTTLHLALLLHDLGKGYEEDHSEVGRRIAEETAQRFALPADEAETLEFLVHRHLFMSHLGLKYDTSQPDLVSRFAQEVGSQERLDMLYLVTCADLAGVGPDVLNSWKVEVLSELYLRASRYLAAAGGAIDDVERDGERRAHLGTANARRAGRFVVRAATGRAAGKLCHANGRRPRWSTRCGGSATWRRAVVRRGAGICRIPTRSNSWQVSTKVPAARFFPAWPGHSPAIKCKSWRRRRTRWPTACC